MYGLNLIRVAVLILSMLMAFAPARVHRAAAAEPVQPAQGAAESRDGVLVLRDGGVLTGQISQLVDRYVVARGGAEISVPAASVAMACDTLDAAYLRQRAEMQSPTAEAHLTLADWCLRFGLYPQAAEELVAARGLDPRHAKLELLERRLAVVSRPAPDKKSPSAAAAANPQTAPTRDSVRSPTSTGELPDGVVERFTRKVQPLLVNNCTTAGCHRPGGPQSFELDRALLHGMANRRSTMHNLSAVLALVDRERPQDSPLLTIPRRDHAGMNHPIFGPRQSPQFQQLVDWVAMVTESTTAAEDTPAADAEQAAAARVEPPPAPPRWREPVEAVSFDESLPPLTPSPVRYGAQLRAWQPKDPFDPEIFNRQTRQAASTTR
jgi:hypothetical protein